MSTISHHPPVESFSPETLNVLSEAFEIAWTFVERSSAPPLAERSALREILARNIVISARRGVTNKVALANFAIGKLGAEPPSLPAKP